MGDLQPAKWLTDCYMEFRKDLDDSSTRSGGDHA